MRFTLSDCPRGHEVTLVIEDAPATHQHILVACSFAWVREPATADRPARSYWARRCRVDVSHPACDDAHPGYWTEELLAQVDDVLRVLRPYGIVDQDFAAHYQDGLRRWHVHLMNARREDRYGRPQGLTRAVYEARLCRLFGLLSAQTLQAIHERAVKRYTAAPALSASGRP